MRRKLKPFGFVSFATPVSLHLRRQKYRIDKDTDLDRFRVPLDAGVEAARRHARACRRYTAVNALFNRRWRRRCRSDTRWHSAD